MGRVTASSKKPAPLEAQVGRKGERVAEASLVLGAIAYGAAMYALARPSVPTWAAVAFAIWAGAGATVVVTAGALIWQTGGQQASLMTLLAVSLDLAAMAVLQSLPKRTRRGERS